MRTLILIPMLLLLGCQTPLKRPQLADQFGDRGYIIQHHEVMFAHAKLKHEAQRKWVIDELDRRLRKSQSLPDFPVNAGYPINAVARVRIGIFGLWCCRNTREVRSRFTRGRPTPKENGKSPYFFAHVNHDNAA
jgi:hypothetical protein